MCSTSSPSPQWRATAAPSASMSTPSTAKAAASSLMPGCSARLGLARTTARLHQLRDLLGLLGEVVAQHQPAEVLQHRDQVHHLARRSRPAQRLRQHGRRAAPGRSGAAARARRARRRAARARRAGRCAAARTPSTPIIAMARRSVSTGPLPATCVPPHLRRVDGRSSSKASAEVGQHVFGDLVGALAAPSQRQARHARRPRRAAPAGGRRCAGGRAAARPGRACLRRRASRQPASARSRVRALR